jgi:hypothetical protein
MQGGQSGKKVLAVFFGLLLLTVAVIFYVGAPGGGTAGTGAPGSAGAASGLAPATASASAAPAVKVVDRQARDELRKRILAGWAAEGDGRDEATRTAARAGKFVARPDADGGGIEPDYVNKVMHKDMRPMARQCYENLLAKDPDAGGRIDLEFTIVGDDELGGIVEEASVAKTSALSDEGFETCIRESAMTLVFPPPAHDGVVTIKAPITFVSNPRDR